MSSPAKKPPLGSGQRFADLEHALDRKGVNDPGALAAAIGRKKLGASRFAKLAAKGRARAARTDDHDADDQ
jgi:hypothetical protein